MSLQAAVGKRSWS